MLIKEVFMFTKHSQKLMLILFLMLSTIIIAGQNAKKPGSKLSPKEQTIAKIRGAFNCGFEVNDRGIPTSLEGNLFYSEAKADPAETAYRFFEKHKEIFSLINPRQELKAIDISVDENSYKHIHFEQIEKGLKVGVVGYRVHINPAGILYSLHGQIDPEARTVDTNPGISEQQAMEIALNDTLVTKADRQDIEPKVHSATLLIGRFAEKLRLVWAISVSRGIGYSWGFWIDAQTGAILESGSSIISEKPQ